MSQTLLDFFTIGIGPSSSHTVGPMLAAAQFVESLSKDSEKVAKLRCDLFGSLAATGKGHGTDRAIVLGFLGERPDLIDIDLMEDKLRQVRESGVLILPDGHRIEFDENESIVFHRLEPLPRHPNGMHFTASDADGKVIKEDVVYSVGGGFVVRDEDWDQSTSTAETTEPVYPFSTGSELLEHCQQTGLSIFELGMRNESMFRPEAETRSQLDAIWSAMQDCVERGIHIEGVLPGGLKVVRRAAKLYERLQQIDEKEDSFSQLDWVNLYAIAVNEENAAGGRVVTAPTNGAAGIIPAVLHYADRFLTNPFADSAVHRFLITAGCIAKLYKENASLSGADVGCQGEVGVACSMAAGGLVEWMGGTPQQVECAAEIGMEHNLGLTCDPVGGLVQIPCIERNAMGAVKAINAARLAMSGDGHHVVSLDRVIRTMRDTGRDMMDKYKETSRGGLAVNVPEC